MSEEFRNDQENLNSQQNSAGTEEHTENQSQNASTAGGTTYSWVNPKLRQDQGQQAGTNPWGAQNSGGWNAAGAEAGKRQQYRYTASGPAGAKPGFGAPGAKVKKSKVKKPRKPMTAGRKWAATVAMALVFGVVAGGTMYGVNRAADYFDGDDNTVVQTTQPLAQTDTSGGSDSETVSASAGAAGTVKEVAKNAMPSLVTISTMSVEEMQSFFGGTQQYEVEGAGTGVIVGQNDSELLIATNNHVVQGAQSLSVGFIDEASVEGKIKGSDSSNDLAVVSVNLSDIPQETMNAIKIATLGDSDELELGDQVVAIGNALGYGQSVTSGYVSAMDRDLTLTDNSGNTIESTGLIQTDAPINSGNSGGALLNMKGELVGINEAKSSMTSSGTTVDGIGFAIPIAKAEPILEKLMELPTRDKVDESQASFLGIEGVNVTSDASEMYGMPTGVGISTVIEDGPAEAAGVKRGDVLTELDGRSISNMDELKDALQYYAAGEQVKIVVQRSDEGEYKPVELTVTLGAASEMNQQQEAFPGR